MLQGYKSHLYVLWKPTHETLNFMHQKQIKTNLHLSMIKQSQQNWSSPTQFSMIPSLMQLYWGKSRRHTLLMISHINKHTIQSIYLTNKSFQISIIVFLPSKQIQVTNLRIYVSEIWHFTMLYNGSIAYDNCTKGLCVWTHNSHHHEIHNFYSVFS